MHPKRQEISDRLRILIPLGTGAGVIVVIGLWTAYFYLDGQTEPGEVPSTWASPYVWLALALVATIAGPPLLYFAVRNYTWLIRHGTEVQGRVISLSPLSKNGLRPVTYGYAVGGVEYTMRRDTPTIQSDKYAPGTPVLVLVDPDRPKRATVLVAD